MLLALLVPVASADPLVAILVVDEEARDRGFRLELEDVIVDDALPVDVAEGESVRIVDPAGKRHELDVAPGEAWVVAGSGGEAWMARIGEDVRSDVVRVRGDRSVVAALAEELGADLHTVDGEQWLVRDEVLFDLPWAETDGLERVRSVALLRADEQVPEAAVDARPPRVRQAAVARPAVAATRRSAEVVATSDTHVETITRPLAQAPAAETPVEQPPEVAPTPDEVPLRGLLDPGPYVGLYLCADDSVLNLGSGGGFAGNGLVGEWMVSAPGVIRLSIAGAPVGRASIEVDRRYCRGVW